jgi:hypothetical protein
MKVIASAIDRARGTLLQREKFLAAQGLLRLADTFCV